jgi:hypothetical protein
MAINISTHRGRTVYTATFSGHVGYYREAIRRTPGTHEGRRGFANGAAGMNTTITVEFDTNDEAVYSQLTGAYKAVCQEKRSKRNQAVEMPVSDNTLPDFVPIASTSVEIMED